MTRKCYKSYQQVSERDCQMHSGGNSIDERQSCYIRQCPMSSWSDNGTCSASCGSGKIRQTRRCLGHDCDNRETQQYVPCQINECPPVVVHRRKSSNNVGKVILAVGGAILGSLLG